MKAIFCKLVGLWCAATSPSPPPFVLLTIQTPPEGVCMTWDTQSGYFSSWAPRADGKCYDEDDPKGGLPK